MDRTKNRIVVSNRDVRIGDALVGPDATVTIIKEVTLDDYLAYCGKVGEDANVFGLDANDRFYEVSGG